MLTNFAEGMEIVSGKSVERRDIIVMFEFLVEETWRMLGWGSERGLERLNTGTRRCRVAQRRVNESEKIGVANRKRMAMYEL